MPTFVCDPRQAWPDVPPEDIALHVYGFIIDWHKQKGLPPPSIEGLRSIDAQVVWAFKHREPFELAFADPPPRERVITTIERDDRGQMVRTVADHY